MTYVKFFLITLLLTFVTVLNYNYAQTLEVIGLLSPENGLTFNHGDTIIIAWEEEGNIKSVSVMSAGFNKTVSRSIS